MSHDDVDLFGGKWRIEKEKAVFDRLSSLSFGDRLIIENFINIRR